MDATFETFKPKDPTIAQFVRYYYRDIQPANTTREIECFPHFHTTLSLYSSHIRTADKAMTFIENATPSQFYTPMQEEVLIVKQVGPVNRIVIVFKPLGIHQFLKVKNIPQTVTTMELFGEIELEQMFQANNVDELTSLLDTALLQRYVAYENEIVYKAVDYIFSHYKNFSVEALASYLHISRRHVARIFTAHFGTPVKKFQEIVLFRKTLEQKLFVDTTQSFTALAYEENFSDQAHLNKTFEKFTQHSPSQFFRKGKLLGEEDTFWHLRE
ncbi:AraC-like DNA-binding protein [Chitinophaga skermanii]|uniref:AraC-like DNA-binding protein n=1 Tax=Chitinophaga skermanii TaxID=331697 RepID=A0A327QI46_9BACT|nr:AraC family transcriptional regulator [Chitinophaga skermanii]RAJ04239.1 AraC-like DNA-binding protein [Chitinophaga skermanii]